MDLNIDSIISTLNKISRSNKLEFSEQDAGTDTTSTDTSSSTPSSTVKKWESGRVMGKTYGGPGYKWESGRTFGKTYMNDPKHKWYSGVQRGKANPASES
jgi:hypothetical protein